MSCYIALDIGGSKVLGGLFSQEGEILAKKKVKTCAHQGSAVVQEQIEKVIDCLAEKASSVAGIGVIVPGIVRNDDVVDYCPNVPFQDYPLGQILREKYQVPVTLGNDVSLALYGEWRHQGYQERHAVGIFVGTGVGGGLIVSDRLYSGKGAGGEIGHMTVEPGGKRCGCDNQGCLEAYAAKSGLMEMILAEKRRGRSSQLYDYLSEDGSMIKSKAFQECLQAGDELTVQLLDQAAYYLGIAVANLTNLLHPDLFLFGGGMMEDLGDYLMPRIEKTARERAMVSLAGDIRMESAKLGGDAGIIGAFYQIMEANTK